MKNEIVLKATARKRQLRRLLFLLVMYGCVATSAMAEGVVIRGNVYGGGNAASVGTTGQRDSAVVNISNPHATVWGQVFGGCNTEGSVIGTAAVNITAGTIGKPDTIQNVVFGGGKGQHTLVEGSVVVNIGKMTTGGNPTPSGSATIWGHVYGGSALGNVNATISENDTTRVGDSTTVVNIIKGIIKGDIYGGGLGDKASLGDGHTNVAANVYGKVTVNIGSGTVNAAGFVSQDIDVKGEATIGGSVYGCNNLNGSPKDSVFVNVYKTAHTQVNQYPDITTLEQLDLYVKNYNGTHYPDSFAIAAVYGGGNQASYSPKDDTDTTTVHVYACEVNTIHTLYGGGNAANATNVKVIIDGGFIDRVFGGGNGYSASGNHNNPNGEDYNPGANISGSATTEIHGGLFRQIFGGSNQYGNVAKVALSIDNASGCTELIDESFGGANEAEISSDVTTTLACSQNKIGTFYGGSNMANINGNVTLNVEGGTYLNVFGGSKGTSNTPATINGDVTLNLYGGTMDNAFGGSDVNGNIDGKITVNVLDKGGACGLSVHNIYGGGRDAAYHPNTPGAYPEVNLIHGKITKKSDDTDGYVFGGGLGATAVVTSNPKVNFGYFAGTSAMADSLVLLVTAGGQSLNDSVVVESDVYGGGEAAAVNGKATVILHNSSCSASNLFGGGKEAGVSDSVWVTMTAGTVTNAVFGGCNYSGTVGGAPTVTVTGGTIGTAFETTAPTAPDSIPNVLFGGGKGAGTIVSGKITLNVGAKTVTPTDTTYVGTAMIHGNVYGGSENGQVDSVNVYLYGDTIYGNVYGGGYRTAEGKIAARAVNVVLDGTKFNRSFNGTAQIFGCNNLVGTPLGQVNVHVYRTIPATDGDTYHVAAIYGGGNEADYVPTADGVLNTQVIIEGCDTTSIKDVYGGGNAAAVPGTEVWILGSTIIDKVYGGGNGERGADSAAHVGFHRISETVKNPYTSGTGKAEVYLVAGNINEVFGGSNSNGDIRIRANVETTTKSEYTTKFTGASTTGCCDKLITQHIYGGGSQADMEGDVKITLDCMPEDFVEVVYGGAQNANVNGNVELTVTSGKFGRVFGGNNAGGNINGTITVNVYEDGCKPLIIGELYGAGNNAPYSIYGLKQDGTPNTSGNSPLADTIAVGVHVFSCTSIGKVYGGGKGTTATVVGNTHVWVNMLNGIIDGTQKTKESHPDSYIGKIGQIFGGGSAAHVIGNTKIDVGTATVEPNEENTELTGVNIISGNYLNPTSDAMNNSVTAGIYGGGEAANIDGNTMLNIGTQSLSEGTNISCNIYGGGMEGDVTGNTEVNIGVEKNDSGSGYTAATILDGKLTITGNVYGGGKGKADNFTCDKAMVGINDEGKDVTNPGAAAYKDKGTHVTIGAGTVNGNVYGGGEVGRVEWNTQVTIGVENATSEPVIEGSVFGAGAGVETHGYSALVRGNSSVNVQGHAHVKGNVYGGGEKASGGRYFVKGVGANPEESRPDNYDDIPDGMPYKSKNGGVCTVNILGYAIIGPNGNATATAGHVFGAGKGVNTEETPYFYDYSTNGSTNIANWSRRMVNYDPTRVKKPHSEATKGSFWSPYPNENKFDSLYVWEYFTTDTLYHEYLQTLALVINTHVNIGESATVKGNVYGGSESGFVQDSTDVNILGGTIGTTTSYGNVFGGGKGLDDFAEAGIVKGITKITISGSENDPLVNGVVYGGGELGDVSENTKVNINGGTIAKNVFGGGKGKGDNFTCDKAMVGINDEGEGQEPGLNANKDKGTHVTITAGTVNGSVYGGGEVGRVEWNTQVTIGADTVMTGPVIEGNVFGAGAGLQTHGYSALVRGNCAVNVQGYAQVKGNIYGGGEKSSAGRYYVKGFGENPDSTKPANYDDIPLGMPYKSKNGGVCDVTVQGNAVIGPDGAASATAGHVFGAGKGVDSLYRANGTYKSKRMVNYNPSTHKNDTNIKGTLWDPYPNENDFDSLYVWEYFVTDANKTDTTKYYEYLQTLALVTKTHVNIDGSAKVKGSVYGGSESGFVQDSTYVRIMGNNSEIGSVSPDTITYGNVFGGGKGLLTFAEAGKVKGNTEVAISGGKMYGNIYGGGELGDVGTISKPNINSYTWTANTGICAVSINGGQIGPNSGNGDADHGNVFGAGKGSESTFECEKAMVDSTRVSISNGTVKRNVYGGGRLGRVEHNTGVTIGPASGNDEPEVLGDVFGAGAGVKTHGYSALVRGNANVLVQGKAKVRGNVYGGGEIATVGRYWVKDINNIINGDTIEAAKPVPPDLPSGMPYKQQSGGICHVTVQGSAIIGPDGDASATATAGNVFGAGKGVSELYNASTSKKMTSDRGLVSFNGYSNKTAEEEYYEFLQTLALTSYTYVTINGDSTVTTVKGNVYGGSESGFVQDSTDVRILGGIIGTTTAGSEYGNVYGGGKGLTTFAEAGKVKGSTSIKMISGNVLGSMFGGCNASGTIVENVTIDITGGTIGAGTTGTKKIDNKTITTLEYTSKASEVHGGGYGKDTYVKGNVTVNIGARTGKDSTAVCTGTAAIYGDVYGGGALGHVNAYDNSGTLTYSTDKKTIISLNKGEIYGNVYGGGLGQQGTGDANIPAYVGGDVEVTQYEVAYYTSYDTTGVATDLPIPKTGRIFGCNNLNGSPKGNVTVEVWKTRRLDNGAHQEEQYEIQAVYSGGNRATYVPSAGKETQVKIHGCPDTMIESVYGGGNAADVPASRVTIYGAREIESVFGGGNGSEKTKQGNTWVDPVAANVLGNANVILYGGNIRSVFGGSNTRGDIQGTATVTDMTEKSGEEQLGECDLRILNVYGGGRSADMEGDVNLFITGCNTKESVENIYGGSYSAKINGNVTLTVTGGVFYKVFGGNDQGGHINGRITVNLEEADACRPLIISNLYGGGNEANYPGAGASQTSGTITVNIKSCTRIDNVYGGALNADVTGNTNLNINLTKGAWATKPFILPATYKGTHDIPNIHNNVIDNAIGTIGNVYGGGDNGKIVGNTNVNIGTETEVFVVDTSAVAGTEVRGKYTYGTYTLIDKDSTAVADGHYYIKKTVDGAHITGNVFGGGKLADVGDYDVDDDHVNATGNTYVNICAKKNNSGVYEPVAFIADSVRISGNVYGGGEGSDLTFKCEKAMITGSDTIVIGNGTVVGTVFGGGKVGRVEGNTNVKIGIGDGVDPADSEATPTSTPIINGDVFGAGAGVRTHGYSALTRGQSAVTVKGNAQIRGNVYGGGQMASVGRYKVPTTEEDVIAAKAQGYDAVLGLPYALANDGSNSGYCTVSIGGYAEIGSNDMKMHHTNVAVADDNPDDKGHVFGAGQGVLPYDGYDSDDAPWSSIPAGTGKVEYTAFDNLGANKVDSAYFTYIQTLALATETTVTIGDHAFVKGSVYGGSENGYVQHNTNVTIQDSCQIGNGDGVNRRYTVDEWASESLAECAHWPYGTERTFKSYDMYAGTTGYTSEGSKIGDDGHTFYGNVFGGGSGRKPYKPGLWFDKAGQVKRNANVTITGGHILTSVYGGNELTSVGTYDDNGVMKPVTDKDGNFVSNTGTCTVNFGGTATLGVPRTLNQITAHPVTCYLFGAGKGDQRSIFDTFTNVQDVVVNVTGGTIYGSVLGGGEDGHVLGNVTMTINETDYRTDNTKTRTKIGTFGTSYVDGNVFGGGRGFSGTSLGAGTVGGNVDLAITGGTILGSVYGGGRMASVGVNFSNTQDASSGQFTEDGNGKTYGYAKINISGGTIGNDLEDDVIAANGHTKGGNVFGGSMGRLTLLDKSPNVLWNRMAQVKSSSVNISDSALIKSNVYGGAEFGTTRDNTTVTIGGTRNEETGVLTPSGTPTINGHVYGGGYGSAIDSTKYNSTIVAGTGSAAVTYLFTPMQYAGCVGGNTNVYLVGDGTVKKNVYGGGEMASVGVINYQVDSNNNYTHAIKHNNGDVSDGGIGKKTYYDFGVSWPYKFEYVPTLKDGDKYIAGGKATVKIIGGSIGTGDGIGFVFGGGKGTVAFSEVDSIAEHRYKEAHIANVREAEVVIGALGGTNNDSVNIGSSVYGGGEDGHVYENASVTIHCGNIRRTVFGGGKGEGKYKTMLWDPDNKVEGQNKIDFDSVYSWTAGRVYGNTEVTIYNGKIGWFVYGGGNMGSVGKGSYSGGEDDYSDAGYGELPPQTGATAKLLWSNTDFTSSGKTTVNLWGGEIGTNTAGARTDGIPYGSVFGGSRGKAAASCKRSPRYRYVPDFFLGYVNNAVINVGDTTGTVPGDGPIIHGSVYGGGQDGHVRANTEVHILKGNIAGQDLSFDTERRSGHVFGAGSGIGTYDSGGTDRVNNSSGSVTCTTLVEVNGSNAHIRGNVYGGGAMASIGPPKTGGKYQTFDEQYAPSTIVPSVKSYTYTKVDIKNGTIGGSVFGASRGPSDSFRATHTFDGETYDSTKYATDIWSEVIVRGGKIGYDADGNTTADGGSVYGGGETGQVKCGVNVNILGGEIATDVYGGGALAHTNTSNLNSRTGGNWTNTTKTTGLYTTTVNLLGGTIHGDAYGGALGRRAFNGNDTIVTPAEAKVFGDVKVNLNGIENIDSTSIRSVPEVKSWFIPTIDEHYQVDSIRRGAIVNRVFGCNNLNGSPQGKVRVHVFATQNASKTRIKEKYAKFGKRADYTYENYSGLTDIASEMGLNVSSYVDKFTSASSTDSVKAVALNAMIDTIAINKYDVRGVYGGGDLAAYMPLGPNPTVANNYKLTKQSTDVVIDGCQLTSIYQVYGGGNAAPVPASQLQVNGTYEISEAFGGGNGADSYWVVEGRDTVWYQNPGANVGYEDFTEVVKNNPKYNGKTEATAYPQDDVAAASTAEMRRAGWRYGDESTAGVATTIINGGKIHVVYGGSNKRGNISTTAVSQYEGVSDCPMDVDETYGAGKDAPIDGAIDVRLRCAKGVKEMFGGSKNSDVNSDINLKITNGSSLERVFGGNNTSGAVNGSITVTIEEGGCEPIRIKELYAGGYLAPYSIYGYAQDGRGGLQVEEIDYGGTIGKIKQCIPIKKSEYDTLYKPMYERFLKQDLIKMGYEETDVPTETQIQNILSDNSTDSTKRVATLEYVAIRDLLASLPRKHPRINVISATRIDTIYGGGYQAKVVGNPRVNVNMTNGKVSVTKNKDEKYVDASGTIYPDSIVDDYVATLPIGTIGHIFGGGNMADIDGNTFVEIGTGEWLNKNDQREMLGTITVDDKDTTMLFTYDDSQEKWTYVRTTTQDESIDGTPTPATNGATVQGAITTGEGSTPVTFTYDSSQGKWTYKIGDAEPVEVASPTAPDNGSKIQGTSTADEITESTLFTYDSSQEKWTYQATIIDTVEVADTPTPFRRAATITGNVFGGGRGVADNFFCDKAMIGRDGAGVDKDYNDIPDYLEGNTNVIIANGTVGGNVYGGGEIGRVEKNTMVTIGLEGDTGEPIIKGSVFGAGSGVETHGYSALVRGNPIVIVQGKAKVGQNVYGGGETASVARYKVVNGSPVALANSTSGNCKVIIRGEAEIGPDSMVMTKTGGPDDYGHVFGAGKGVIPTAYAFKDDGTILSKDSMPKRMILKDSLHTAANQEIWDYVYSESNPNIWEYFPNDSTYLSFIETLALSSKTDVTIGGHAFVKGSVYGGSENGIVQYDTHVRIQDSCQIGNGYVQMNDDGTRLTTPMAMNRRYTSEEWKSGHLIMGDNDSLALKNLVGTSLYQHSLPECASWPYEAPYGIYDRLADENGKYKDHTDAQGGYLNATDGHTFYGNVFGGGSGFYPYKPGKWHRSAGLVRGNTVVDVTGGHILTSLYGGNEMTDVGTYRKDSHGEPIIPDTCGKCIVNMVGGTLGVPRTMGQIAAHPVTCYLFGAGKGDPRTFFNTWTNVDSVEVNISGNARIYGSVFGGGEDGHILESAVTNIGLPVTLNIDGKDSVFTDRGVLIGTTGTSYVDGNVFGAGRGFTGDALTAGSVGGNVNVNIGGGTMLGSIYGGGRLASVGIGFNPPTDSHYGSFQDGPDHGFVTINISGGKIGNDLEDITVEHTKGGNVYGGSMGRLEKLDGTTINNALWPQLAQVKSTTINISGDSTVIKGNVYGGGELGSVRDSTSIVIGKVHKDSTTLTKPTLLRDVFGGGYGSLIGDTVQSGASAVGFVTSYAVGENNDTTKFVFRFTPMQWAGCVGIKTDVNIYDGWVKKCVYGGGERASVGIINYMVDLDNQGNPTDNYSFIVKHEDEDTCFALSWPYETQYVPGYPGDTHINIYGGRLGITGKDQFIETGSKIDNGDIYGGSKGKAGDRYAMAFCGNVGSSEININYPDSCTATPNNYKTDMSKWCIAGAVYGGGENGHVMGDTHLTLTNGLVGHALYGGGSGKGQFEQRLKKVEAQGNPSDSATVNIYSITAGKVYGNTYIDMTGGYVVRNIYGGGNMGSVGKGNYAGAPDDYSKDSPGGGYGEKILTNLWDSTSVNSLAFLNSGQTHITVTGGQVGYVDTAKVDNSMKDGLPYGNVFGGCRGESAPNITERPRFLYSPQFFSGYVNKSNVTIGTEGQANDNAGQKGKAPLILGSVFGGGQDGHVRQDTYVTVNSGQIGLSLNGTDLDTLSKSKTNLDILGALYNNDETVNPQWLYRGNVFGAGSGIGQYEFDFNYNGNTNDTVYYGTDRVTGQPARVPEKGYSTSAGSVTRFTNVEVKGGIVNRNVYGGGSLASVGPAKIPATRIDAWHPEDSIANHRDSVGWQSLNSVTIGGLTIADKVIRPQIGDAASVKAGYGGNIFGGGRGELSIGENYGTSVWTKVYIKNGSNILGSVFGGGDNGTVYKDTDVQIGEPKKND